MKINVNKMTKNLLRFFFFIKYNGKTIHVNGLMIQNKSNGEKSISIKPTSEFLEEIWKLEKHIIYIYNKNSKLSQKIYFKEWNTGPDKYMVLTGVKSKSLFK